MKLTRSYFEGPTENLVDDPTLDDIRNAIDSTRWENFAFIRLEQDPENFLEGSGRPYEDGLSMFLSVDGVPYVTEVAPVNPRDMIPFFDCYLNGDMNELYSLIFDARNRGLTSFEIQELINAPKRRGRGCLFGWLPW